MGSFPFDGFIVSLANEIDHLSNRFVFDGYTALASLLKAPFGAMIVLYIVLTGYAITQGIIERPQRELLRFSIKTGVIYMTAMNWDWFAIHVRDLFVLGSESIASTLMQAVHRKTASGSINLGLQHGLNDILSLGTSLFEAGSLRKLTPYFAGMMVFLSGAITIGIAFIEIVIGFA